jgi:hypothetical protein
MMMMGNATGKGLNVKGKSAKKGVLSGYVPFLQISEEKHKPLVSTAPKTARIRIYFQTEAARGTVVEELQPVLREMVNASDNAEKQLQELKAGNISLDDEEHEAVLCTLRWKMDEPCITPLEEFAPTCFGLSVPERLLWEAYVIRRDISHPEGWETGRPSEAAFMDMNLHAIREPSSMAPTVVLWQHDKDNPMNPRGLLIAYEEDKVRPVSSDFDAFLIGSSGMTNDALPEDQVDLVNWTLANIEDVLNEPKAQSWTSRWLDVLKREAKKGFHPELPKFGFGDPRSYDIIAKAVEHLNLSGAVRHGAECFNFYFPQELDDEFLIVWDGFDKVPWKYVKDLS